MLKQIKGLHHVTSMASSASLNNRFFTNTLGLRRVKQTVNFDQPSVYHLYYGDEIGSPGSVMTYFPFPGMARGARGAGEVGITNFSVPNDALGFWEKRLGDLQVDGLHKGSAFGEERLYFKGPDGDDFALIGTSGDDRLPWTTAERRLTVDGPPTLRVSEVDALRELMGFMNYEAVDTKDGTTRLLVDGGNGAHMLEIENSESSGHADQGAGSVHHIAFAVEDRAAQLEVRKALMDTGYAVTPVIDRDYFWAIYFRTPGGILFEIATNEPGFDRDEDTANLGEALKLPSQHEHLREMLEQHLEPLEAA